MALPKIKHSAYTHKLKGIDKTVSFRPYTNAEQKILLLAKEEGKDDKTRMLDAITQILSNCIMDNIEVYDLPMFDIEDIFIRIREKSVGEIIPVKFRYNYDDENGVKKTDFVTVSVNIKDIQVQGEFVKKARSIIVDKANNIGIKLRYPTLRDIKELEGSTEDSDLLSRCIEVIFDENEVYDPKDQTKEEMDEFIDDIEAIPMLEIKEFFEKMPKIFYETQVYKKHLDETETVKIQGLEGFFT